MAEKPTYEELEQRVKALEKEVVESKPPKETLRQREWLKYLLENNPAVTYTCEPGGDYAATFMSERVKDRFGYDPDEFMDNRSLWADNIFPADKDRVFSDLSRLFEQGYHTHEYRFKHKDGTYRWIYDELKLVRDSNGNPLEIVGYMTDITERKRAEEQTKQLQEYLDLQIERMPIGLIVWDTDFHVKSWNPAAEKIFGLTAEESIGKHPYDLIVPKGAQPHVDDIWRRLLEGDTTAHSVNENTTKDGHTIICQWSNTPLKKADGTVVGVLSMVQDITERKLAEEALGESEARYRALFETSADGILIADSETKKFRYANPALCEILGYTVEELRGMGVADIHPKEDLEHIISEFEAQTRGDKAFTPNAPCLRRNGTVIYADINATTTLIDGRKCTIGLFRDITERKQAEVALRESEQKYRTLFEDSGDAIYITSREGEFIDVNQSALDLFGYTRKEMVGLDVLKIYVDLDDRRRFQEEIEEKGSVKNYEVKFCKKDGTEMDCLLTSTVRRADDGSILGYQGIIRDVTEGKRLEAQFQQAQKLEAIGTLAGGIAHDFNNLLTGVQGNVSLMLMDVDVTHPHYKRLKSIEKQVQSGAQLTSHLLGYARRGKYQVRGLDLNQLVKEVSETFGRTRKQITIHRELAKDLFVIEADPWQIEQVLLNLFVNAADAMPVGGDLILKTLNVTHKDMKGKLYDPKPGNYVLLTVTDTGTGIYKKTMERIFDPFFTTKERDRGTGLGLASAYGIIKSHGGYIDVESKRRQGSTFIIYLPASMKKVQKVVKAAERFTKGTGTVLLVDDEEVILEVGRGLLEHMGYRVLIAKNGKEAVRVYRKNQDDIDIVILDMVMPNMGGGEAYDRMSKINPDVKVLLSSGYGIDGEATEILKRGCNGFIHKPFTMEKLSRKIRRILGKK